MEYGLVVPSLKVSGGVREALRLAEDMATDGLPVHTIAMWRSPHTMDTDLPLHQLCDAPPRPSRAAFELPLLWWRFRRWLQHEHGDDLTVIFTHYVTLPLSLLLPRGRRVYFVQDLEWKFVGSRLLSAALRAFIIYFYRRGRILTANNYLTSAMHSLGIEVQGEALIWADSAFATDSAPRRDIDFVMVLRKGHHKRLDLYLAFICAISERAPTRRIAVISTEDSLAAQVRDRVAESHVRPSVVDMRAIYARSKVFVHLSEHEGFGLPPLEAMGAGCVPLCRDSGGVRAFMAQEAMTTLLVPRDASLPAFVQRALDLVEDTHRLQVLSEQARRVFESGMRRSAQRQQLLRRVLSL